MNGQSLPQVEAALRGNDNPFTFRRIQAQVDHSDALVPSIRVDQPVERTLEEITGLEPSFMAHEAVTGLPFVASHFKMDRSYPALSPKEQAPFLEVESHIKKEIEAGKYVDTAEAARSIIKGLEEKLGLNDHNDPYYKADRIAAFLKADKDYQRQETLKARIVKQAAAPAPKPEPAPVLPQADRTLAAAAAKAERENLRLQIEVEKAKLRAKAAEEESRRAQKNRAVIARLLGSL